MPVYDAKNFQKFFNSAGANFVEAPILFENIQVKSNTYTDEEFNESTSLYVATGSKDLYKSLEKLFTMFVNKNNLDYQGKLIEMNIESLNM